MTNLQIYDVFREMVVGAESDGWDLNGNGAILDAARNALNELAGKLGVEIDVDGGVIRG